MQAFNGKKWEKFNSEKVASLAYARIQGKVALLAHFQNSSLMNEDKWCRPILFQLEGQETADQVKVSSSYFSSDKDMENVMPNDLEPESIFRKLLSRKKIMVKIIPSRERLLLSQRTNFNFPH